MSRALPAVPSRASPPLSSSRFSPHRMLLGDTVNAESCNNTERCLLSHVRSRVYRRDWRQFPVGVHVSSQLVVHSSSRRVIKVSYREVLGEFKWMSNRRRYEWIRGTHKNTGGRRLKILHVTRRPNLRVIFGVWDYYSLCVEIRCWETTSGDWEF
jgi:hypothetical protein